MAATTRATTPTPTCPFPVSSATGASSAPVFSETHASKESVPSTSLTPAIDSVLGSGFRASPVAKSPKSASSSRYSPQPLTGATAVEEQRRYREQKASEDARQTSPNPALAAINRLIGGGDSEMSKPRDGPPSATQVSEPLAKVAKAIQVPDQVTVDSNAQTTSPVSLSSFGSAESTTAPTATAMEPTTAGPLASESMPAPGPPNPMEHHGAPPPPNHAPAELQSPANRAFTYPGPVPPDHDPRAPTRGMSLPMSGYAQNSPKSPSTKRHKCPYCSTDFTRHHNLKSHLLTHSQEKPYECPTCQARFRRLHDLKRHTKLHTGERPHTCPKCGRRFARGDALARHNKGAGGCAGRRASFGIDEENGEARHADESMDGLVYHGGEHEDDKMDEGTSPGASARRVSEPSRRSNNRQDSFQAPYHQHSSTYPPVPGHPAPSNVDSRNYYPTGGNPPAREHPPTLSPRAPQQSTLGSIHYNAGNPPVFGGMTESPKPISPGQPDTQPRLGMSELNRGTGRGSLPPPGPTSNPPQLPSLPGLAPSNGRVPIPPQPGRNSGPAPGPSMLHQQVPGPGTGSTQGSSLSSHSHTASSGGSIRDFMGGREPELWAYIRDLEARLCRSQEDNDAKIRALTDEVSSLKAQLQQYQQQPPR